MGNSSSKKHLNSIKHSSTNIFEKGSKSALKLWKNVKSFKMKKTSSNAEEEFCFENFTRFQAICVLNSDDHETGTFLVRRSETYPSKLVLSVLSGNKVLHFLIHSFGKFYFLRRNLAFRSINDLVRFYSISANSCKTGFLFKLKKWIKPKNLNESSIHWKGEFNQVKIQELICKAEMSELYSGTWRGRVDVSVKKVENGENDERKKKRILNDANIMLNGKNSHILKSVLVHPSDDAIYTVMEPVRNGSLLNYLRNDCNKNKINLKFIVKMASQTADAMNYLHSSGYVHGDLNANSLFVTEYKIKLGNFYFTKELNEKYETIVDSDRQLNAKWTAPEVFDMNSEGLRVYRKEADVWSFGILLYVLITCGEEPYAGIPTEQVLKRVKNENYRMRRPSGLCTNKYYEIMEKCWQTNPEARPNFEMLNNYLNDYSRSLDECSY